MTLLWLIINPGSSWGRTLMISHSINHETRSVFSFSAHCVQSGNVLVWYTKGSHWINLRIVLETLIDRGHNVTVLVPNISLFMKAKESERFFYQPFNASVDEQDVRDFIEEFVYFSVYETDQLNDCRF